MKVITRELPQYETLELYILSDVHLGDPNLDKKLLRSFIEEVTAEENRCVIVNGDIINNATRTSVSDVYGECLTPNEQMDACVKLLTPIRDRIVAITEGNHEARSYKQTGILIMNQVAKRLDIEEVYSTGAYLLFLRFGKSHGRMCRKMIYSIYGSHGSGGGRKIGGKANRLIEMSDTIDADIFIHSHTHVPLVIRQPFFRVDYNNRKATEIDQLFINSSGFLLHGGYGEDFGFPPASRTYPKIILDGSKRLAKAVI